MSTPSLQAALFDPYPPPKKQTPEEETLQLLRSIAAAAQSTRNAAHLIAWIVAVPVAVGLIWGAVIAFNSM
jgi:hypothetical protein